MMFKKTSLNRTCCAINVEDLENKPTPTAMDLLVEYYLQHLVHNTNMLQQKVNCLLFLMKKELGMANHPKYIYEDMSLHLQEADSDHLAKCWKEKTRKKQKHPVLCMIPKCCVEFIYRMDTTSVHVANTTDTTTTRVTFEVKSKGTYTLRYTDENRTENFIYNKRIKQEYKTRVVNKKKKDKILFLQQFCTFNLCWCSRCW